MAPLRRILFPTFLTFSVCTTAPASSAPAVVYVSPTPNLINADPLSQIVVEFDTSMDAATFNDTTVAVFGHWSGVHRGQFQFENNNTIVRFTPTYPLSAGELVTVSLSKNIRDQGGAGMARGYSWTFWVRTLTGTLDLTGNPPIPIRRQGEGHIQTYGAYGGDIDADGHLDITVVNEISHDIRVFLNDSLGNYSSFTVYPIPTGNTPSPNEGADFNGDGIMDFAVGNTLNDSVSIFLGDGTGGFLPVQNYQAASGVRGIAIFDCDGDGRMDIATANRIASNVSLLRGNGDGTFAPRVNVEAGGSQETAIAAADANGDGIPDLFVGAFFTNEMIVLLGDGNGAFTFSSKVTTGSRPWMIAVGDVNGDRNVDVVSANSAGGNASVILGNGQGGLSPAVNYSVGSFPLAIDIGDLDGDGDLDMVVSSYSAGTWTIYENNGSGTFVNPRTLSASTAASCATLYDRDNDGDLDHTGIDEIDDLIFLFDNSPPTSVVEEGVPAAYDLSQNFPNPFNPLTVIRYSLAVRGFVSLKVYNVLGQEVAALVNEEMKPGRYEVTWDATGVSSGVYYYRLMSSDFAETKKLLLLK